MSERKFSKGIIAKFLYSMSNFLIKKNKFDNNSGTFQLKKHFNDNLIIAINDLKLSNSDENWDKRKQAEEYIYSIINTIVDYGKKEMCNILLTNFDLNDTLNAMVRKGEKIDD